MNEDNTYLEKISLSPLFPINRCRISIYDFVNQIDYSYKGLGIPVLYGVLSILANKSVFYIGSRGTGKTRIVNLIPDVTGTEVSKWDTFTYGELSNYCQTFSQDGTIKNKKLVFKVEEFSTFSQYHKKQFLTTATKIISDRSYRHIINSLNIDIQDCQLTMLLAIQPRIYNYLCTQYTEWDTLSYDRFTKFLLLNPLRDRTLRVNLNPTLPRKINHPVKFNRNHINLTTLVELFEGHVSTGRAEIYAEDYAVALAQFMGAAQVEQQHINLFHRLFHPYLTPFSQLQQAADLDSPIKVNTGDMRLFTEIGRYRDYVAKEKLAKDLLVNERSIERPAKRLLERGLIEKPSSHAGKYRLIEPYRKFFTDYENGSIFP